MNNTSSRILALAVATVLLGLVCSSNVQADSYGPYHPYTYGHNGYWDEHHGYHHWEHHDNHDGYYNRRSDGVRVFIRI